MDHLFVRAGTGSSRGLRRFDRGGRVLFWSGPSAEGAVLRLADVSMASGERHRVGKLFGSPALTFLGLPETGPIFASHLSWYIDESIGIPISNAFVVPVDVGGLRGLRPPGTLP